MSAVGSTNWDAAAAVASCPMIRWSGDVWRCHSRRYAGDSPGGSLKVSGRFHRGADAFAPDQVWPALYTSLAIHVALGERLRHTTPASLAALATQRVSQLRVDLQVVLVTCGRTGCATLGVPDLTLDDLCDARNYEKTQELAKAARNIAEAMLTPSCTGFHEGKLIVFPDKLRPESEIRVVNTIDPNLDIDWSTTTAE